MAIAPEALDLIKEFEGYLKPLKDGTDRVRAYQDPGDVPTIGWGSTRYFPGGVRVKLSDPPITKERATECLMGELELEDGPTIRKYTTVPLHPLMEGALYSFCYNLGVGAYRASTLRTVINERQWDRVPAEFAKWRMAAGRVLPGLSRRRAAEAAMFMKGVRLQQEEAKAAKATKPDIPVTKLETVTTAVVPPASKPAPTRPQIGFGRLWAWLTGR